MSRQQINSIAFFVGIYMSPFLALFAAEAYMVTAFPAVSFLSLLTTALIIVGAHTGIILTYRLAQPYLQRLRIMRMERNKSANLESR